MERGYRIVGRHEIVREIGRGGMATVFLARQIGLDRFVALKGLLGLGVDEPGSAERFLREARLAGSLNHDRIVTVYDYFDEAGTPFISMEYLARGSLRPIIGRLTLAQCLAVLADMLDGLAYAERRGIVHRDIKPENVLVDDAGRVKIADFGIAKAVSSVASGTRLTAPGAAIGTPAYMAPEQAMGQDVTAAADRYAVGVTAYELLAGAPPFQADNPMALLLRHVSDPVPRLREKNPSVHPRLAAWVERLLSKDPNERFDSAESAQTALQDGLAEIFGEGADMRERRRAGLLLVAPPNTDAASESTDAPTPAPGAQSHERYETYREPSPVAPYTSDDASLAAEIPLPPDESEQHAEPESRADRDRPIEQRAVAPTEPPVHQAPQGEPATPASDPAPSTPTRSRIAGRRPRAIAAVAALAAAATVLLAATLLPGGDKPKSDPSKTASTTPTPAEEREPRVVDAGKIAPGGEPVPVAVEPGTVAKLRLSGRESQRFNFVATGVDFGTGGSARIELHDPENDERITYGDVSAADSEIDDSITLEHDGRYIISIEPDRLRTGRLTLSLPLDRLADTRVDGKPLTVRLDKPGQNALITLHGRKGQRFNLVATGVDFGTGGSTRIELHDPENDERITYGDVSAADSEIDDSITLEHDGRYIISIEPDRLRTGRLTLSLPLDRLADTRVDGKPLTVRLDKPGQNALITLHGRKGQRFNLVATGVDFGTGGSTRIELHDPENDERITYGDVSAADSEIDDSITLEHDGRYIISIEPDRLRTGRLTLSLPLDRLADTRVDGKPLTVRLDKPGQNALITLHGRKGQRFNLVATGVDFGTGGSARIELHDPENDERITYGDVSAADSEIDDSITLEHDGRYIITIEPDRLRTGRLTLRLPAD